MKAKSKQSNNPDFEEVWCLSCLKPYKLSVSNNCPNCSDVSEVPSVARSKRHFRSDKMKGGAIQNGRKKEED